MERRCRTVIRPVGDIHDGKLEYPHDLRVRLGVAHRHQHDVHGLPLQCEHEVTELGEVIVGVRGILPLLTIVHEQEHGVLETGQMNGKTRVQGQTGSGQGGALLKRHARGAGHDLRERRLGGGGAVLHRRASRDGVEKRR